MQARRIVFYVARILCAAILAAPAHSFAVFASCAVPLDSEHWQVKSDSVEFQRKEGIPQGLMVMKAVKEGVDPVAKLMRTPFENGTIEFDVKPDGGNWPTVRFHKTNEKTAEEFYIRPGDNCAVSDDCTQYAPIVNGRMLWDSYYQYQHAANFRMSEWNHIKMVISGRRMNVYFNREATPSLQVGELMGEAKTGDIEFQGPASFANVWITPGDVGQLSPVAAVDPSIAEGGYLRHWEVAAPISLPELRDPTFSDFPGSTVQWKPVAAERFGMVNLARLYPRVDTHGAPSVAWLKTTVKDDRSEVVHVSAGFARRIAVFVNGVLVYSGQNLYNDESHRRAPDGRLNIENGSFDLPLEKGANQIVVGVSSNSLDMSDQYSFGLELRITDAGGKLLMQ